MSNSSLITARTLLFADAAAGLLAFALSSLCVSVILSGTAGEEVASWDDFLLPALPFFLGCIGYLSVKGHYFLKASWWLQVRHILFAAAAAFVASSLCFDIWQMQIPVMQNGLLWLFTPPCLILMRWVARNSLAKRDLWAIPTSVAGSFETIRRLLPALRAETYLTYDVQGAFLIDAETAQVEEFKRLCPEVHVYSSLDSLEGYVFFCPGSSTAAQDEILARLEERGARFAYVPPVEGYFLYKAEPQRFFGSGVIALEPETSFLPQLGFFAKDILDRASAAIALVLLSPVFIPIAIAIRRDGGPAIYGHTRLGKNGQPFTCLKFRSMVLNSREILNELLRNNPDLRKEYEATYKLKNDPRITKIGQFLRKTSLDELPQLINVLRGEMSLTGPRPIVEDEKKYYAEKIGDYLSVKPGMTGLWQVSGRSDMDYDRRVYLDSWYVKNWSLWNDVIILFKTVFVVLKRKGAY